MLVTPAPVVDYLVLNASSLRWNPRSSSTHMPRISPGMPVNLGMEFRRWATTRCMHVSSNPEWAHLTGILPKGDGASKLG